MTMCQALFQHLFFIYFLSFVYYEKKLKSTSERIMKKRILQMERLQRITITVRWSKRLQSCPRLNA